VAGLQVSEEVAAVVGAGNLAQLAATAAGSFECARCGATASLSDGPATVVAFRDGILTVARIAHESCSSSQVVDVPEGTLRVAEQAPAVAVAAVLPHSAGLRPVLVVEPGASVSILQDGERIDGVTAHLLGLGLHLVAALGHTPGEAPGWQVELTSAVTARALYPGGDALYDGDLIMPPPWLRLVADRGGCLLLVASGLGLAEGLGEVAEGMRRLNSAARAGRLVGALVPVVAATPG
jgi:hypothetical protein